MGQGSMRIEIKAIDVIPYLHSVMCRFDEDGPSISIQVVYQRWNDDGTILFGLDNHTGFSASPDELVDVVPCEDHYQKKKDEFEKRHQEFLAKKPDPEKVKLKTQLKMQIKSLEDELKKLDA